MIGGRYPVRKWTDDLSKLLFTHVLLIGVPTIFYFCLRTGGISLVNLHMAIATFFLFSSIVIIIESTAALMRRYAIDTESLPTSWLDRRFYQLKRSLGIAGRRLPATGNPVPRATILVAAYLPNEQDIILETLRHIFETVHRPNGGLEVILAYNTPTNLPVEADLHLLAEAHPELRLLRVEGSRSKAENLNAALALVTGEITCILDADHFPPADCFERAWRWLEYDYDVVQGRNVIRNHRQNLLTQNIAIEFEMVYGVAHSAKSYLTDSTIFGGSNGYWRTEALQRIRFNPAMLTEDIDASMRTLLSGYRIVHDRSIVTTELAPQDFNSFWFQRKRWSHGWLEVSLKYQRRVWKSQKLTLWQKVYWTYLLYYCVFYSLIALQILPLVLSRSLHPFALNEDNAYLLASTLITFASGFYATWVTLRVSALRYPTRYYLQHAGLICFYTVLKNMISVVALYDHLHGFNRWVVTPRAVQRQRTTSSRVSEMPKALALSQPTIRSLPTQPTTGATGLKSTELS
jgi:cellulose synthase/poly-beta-1,6-N-acetylglucosamine synthase-like glycosyltransferase